MKMIQRQYTLQFNAPAFLGNAEQSGQWRTPPFKAQLRQWWRVAYAASKNFRPDVAAMREAEGRLFGHAWLENDRNKRDDKIAARKSEVRLRLGQWSVGTLPKARWTPLDRVNHPEAPSAPADLYLGYGPVTLPRGEKNPALKANAAIQADEHTTFSLAYPDEHAPLIEQALALMDRFGTVGGRSRNGWGSYTLTHADGQAQTENLPLRDWKSCLTLDWPHAIGKDDKALIWQTRPHDDWRSLMKELAIIKIGLRTQFVFPNVAPPHPQALPRHWLSYPITRHATMAFDQNARLPNQLRFKVRPMNDRKLVGIIFHVPHLPPSAFHPDRVAIERTWQSVHVLLDELARSSARDYASITDVARRAQLKPQLDSVAALQRVSE